MTTPQEPTTTDPGQPDPEPAPGTVAPADQPGADPNYHPKADPNHPEYDPNFNPEEGDKYDGGDIPQTEPSTESDENQTTE
jgi:hypothetical protein